jgi:hypothetical protein
MAPPTRLVARGDRGSLEWLLTETILRRKIAETIKIEATDDALGSTTAKYVAEAVAARIVAAQLPAISPEPLVEALVERGVKADRAVELATLLQVERTVQPARELPSDAALADLVIAYVNASPYIQLAVMPANAPRPIAVEPEPVGPPRHENPSAVGRPPSMAAVDAAIEAREREELEAIATGRDRP